MLQVLTPLEEARAYPQLVGIGGDFRCGEPGGIAGAGMTDRKSRRCWQSGGNSARDETRGGHGWGMKPDANG